MTTPQRPYPPQPPRPYSPVPYQPPQPPYVVALPLPRSGGAVASMVLGICALALPCLFGVPAVIAVILGHMAKREIRASGGRLGGDGMATAGLVMGYIGIAPAVLFITWLVLGASFATFMPDITPTPTP